MNQARITPPLFKTSSPLRTSSRQNPLDFCPVSPPVSTHRLRAVLITLLIVLFFGFCPPLRAQGDASVGTTTSGFVQVINKMGEEGLKLFRAVLFVFLMIYAVLLGVAVAFGQAGAQEISSFVLGTIVAAGAQLIASLYLAILT